MIEVKLSVSLLNNLFVCFLEVLGKDNISVFTHSMHSGLLADGVDVGCTDLLGSRHEVLQVNLFTEVHLVCDCLEDQTLLSPVWKWELNLSV